MTRDELKTFKKRFIGAILASDMAKHVPDLDSFKHRLEINGIKKELNNGGAFLDRTDEASIFESQQFLMEIALHSADLSVATRPNFDIVKQWSFLLFEEFFV